MPEVVPMTREQFSAYVASRPPVRWVDDIFLHHTANKGQIGLQGWLNVMHYHVDKLGWSDTGYHVGVDRDGSIVVFKLRDMERAGAHIGDPYNQNSVAVCLAGNFSEEYSTPLMAETLKYVCEVVANHYQVPARPRFHRDVDATACPGWNVTHELVDRWLAGDFAGVLPPTAPPVTEYPPADLTFQTQPKAPFPSFTFIKGSGEALGLGDESPQVRDLEMSLYFLGYITYTPRTYLFDEGTKAGVKAFQEKFVPPADGIYGIFTATALQREVDRVWSGHPPIITPPNPPGSNPDQGIVNPPTPPISPTRQPPITIPESTPPVEDSVLEHPKAEDEIKPLLEKILELLGKLMSWFKQIFKVE